MKPDGSDAQRLTSGEGSEGEPAYSRDRSKIAFVGIALNDILNFSRRSQIYLMNADGSNQRQLTNLPAGQTARVPTFSDDGTKIAFGGGSDGNGGIFVINVDGSNLRQLTTQGSNPSWSKNNKIAFDALQPTAIQQSNTQAQATTESKRLQARDVFVPGGSYIFIINPDGSGLTRITNTGSEHTPSFSPDGNKIVYGRSGIGVDAALFSVNADGSNSTLLRNGGLSPVFSPDGQQIAFEDSPGVLSEIFTIKVDGTGLTRLTNNTSLDQDPYWR
jgi:Tol biopolymer transport system component